MAPTPLLLEDDDTDDEPAWEVEALVGKRRVKGLIEYEVKWKGSFENSWEPVENLNCEELIEEYEKSNRNVDQQKKGEQKDRMRMLLEKKREAEAKRSAQDLSWTQDNSSRTTSDANETVAKNGQEAAAAKRKKEAIAFKIKKKDETALPAADLKVKKPAAAKRVIDSDDEEPVKRSKLKAAADASIGVKSAAVVNKVQKSDVDKKATKFAEKASAAAKPRQQQLGKNGLAALMESSSSSSSSSADSDSDSSSSSSSSSASSASGKASAVANNNVLGPSKVPVPTVQVLGAEQPKRRKSDDNTGIETLKERNVAGKTSMIVAASAVSSHAEAEKQRRSDTLAALPTANVKVHVPVVAPKASRPVDAENSTRVMVPQPTAVVLHSVVQNISKTRSRNVPSLLESSDIADGVDSALGTSFADKNGADDAAMEDDEDDGEEQGISDSFVGVTPQKRSKPSSSFRSSGSARRLFDSCLDSNGSFVSDGQRRDADADDGASPRKLDFEQVAEENWRILKVLGLIEQPNKSNINNDGARRADEKDKSNRVFRLLVQTDFGSERVVLASIHEIRKQPEESRVLRVVLDWLLKNTLIRSV